MARSWPTTGRAALIWYWQWGVRLKVSPLAAPLMAVARVVALHGTLTTAADAAWADKGDKTNKRPIAAAAPDAGHAILRTGFHITFSYPHMLETIPIVTTKHGQSGR